MKMKENIKLLYIDLFCGAGGTTTGVELATLHGEKCAKVIACVNHDAHAIASHLANHPEAKHFTEDIRTLELSPLAKITAEARRKHPKALLVLWASLECTNFSRAKGGLPRDADSRTLADHLPRYINAVDPDFVMIENVEEFMSWGALDEHGKPVSRDKGSEYIRWVDGICKLGYTYSWKIINSANLGAYTCRKRFFGQFSKCGLPHAFPEATYSKNGDTTNNLFGDGLKKWKAVRDVLNFDDEGESIFGRKKTLVEATLRRIYAGLVKFVAGGNEEHILVKYNSVNQKTGKYNPPSMDDPSPVVPARNALGVATCHFISKQFSGDDASKNIGIDRPVGTITCIDHHALLTYYRNGSMIPTDKPAPTIPTHDRVAKLQIQFIANEYSGGGQLSSIETACPTLLAIPKQKLVSCFLMNPQYQSAGGSVDKPCFTLIARMDKMPPYLVQTTEGVGIEVYEEDSPMTRTIKEFMAAYGILDIKMRMLKVPELLAIQGFPKGYKLIGTLSEQKKYIGNAVEVTTSRRLCEALAERIAI